MNKNVRNFVIKPLKVLGWIIGTLIFLILLITLSTRIPFVQNFIKDKAIAFYKNKTGTEARLGSLYVNFPSTVEVNELYLEDLAGDTLAYAGEISVRTNLLDLLKNKLSLDQVYARDLVGNIHNSENDSIFNYQFIIDAFAPADTAAVPVDTTAAPFDFAVYGAEVENARVWYADLYNGMELQVSVGNVLAEVSVFDLNNSLIDMRTAQLSNSSGSFRITKDIPSSTDPTSAPFYVNGEEIIVSNVDFTFEDEPGGIRVINEIGNANITADSVNIVDQVYDARKITLLDTYVSIDIFDTGAQPVQEESDSTDAAVPFSLYASSENINMGNVNFRFYDHSKEAASKGFDPFYMWFQDVGLDARNVEFRDGYASGRIENLQATENKGFVLRELSADFNYAERAAEITGLQLVSANSRIEGDISVRYPDGLERLAEQPGKIGLELTFPASVLDRRDLEYFVPSLESSFPAEIPAAFKVRWQGNVSGRVDDLLFGDFLVELFDYTRLELDGRLSGLPDAGRLNADLPEFYFQTLRSEAEKLLPDTLLPAQITLPDTLQLSGSIAGGLEEFTSSFTLDTNLGDITADLDLNKEDSVLHYKGTLAARKVEAGIITGNADLGPVTAVLEFDGQGTKPEEISAQVNGKIESFVYRDYTYDTVTLIANLAHQEFEGAISMADDNLTFDFNGSLGFSDSVNNYAFDLEVEKADLQQLHFTDSEFQLLGNVSSRISASSVDDLNGYVLVKDTYLNRNNQIIPVDSLYFNAMANEDSTAYHVFSNFIEADFSGTFRLRQLTEVIRQHISKYYDLRESDTIEFTSLRPQSFDMEIDIKNPAIFTQLVPDLNELIVENISGQYNSEEWRINLDVNVSRVVYGGLEGDSVFFHMDSDESVLTFGAGAEIFATGPVRIRNILLEGDIESNNVMTSLHILDEERKDRFLFGGIFISLEDHYRFMFTPGKFITNYDSWTIKPSNSIDFYPHGTWVQNLFLENEEQEVRIYSENNSESDSVLNVELVNFRLNEFGNITQDSVPLISGIIQGQSSFNTVSSGLAFTSDITIEQFSYKGDTLGQVQLVGDTDDGQNYTLEMGISGNENNIRLSGTYDADSAGYVDMNLNIDPLALASVQAFTAGQLRDMKGNLSGNISIKGSARRPDIDGQLRFNQVAFRPTYIGSLIRIDNQDFRVNNTGLVFNDFTMTDQDGDEGVLSGEISTDDFLVYNMNLDIRTRNFKVINKPLPDGIPSDASPYFGDLDVTSTISVTGNSVQPIIKLNASFTDGSTFAYVVPEATITEEEQNSVVEWFDQDLEEIEYFKDDATRNVDSVQQALRGIDLNAKLTVTPENELTIVIDPLTGDKLTVKGNADLNYDIKTSGQQTLTGRFEVTEGSYLLNFYNLMRREFSIQEGSYILWTGDPLNAIMNVTAVYNVRAAAPPGLNNYQGKLEYLVFLDIGGQLLQPEISFRLGLDPDTPAPIQVEAWVNQQNTQAESVNRQVFGLLLFQAFFPDDSYASAGNVNFVENTARSSVSRILSSQLNRLSDQIQGIDLTIDLDSYEDYTSDGDAFGRTELELGVSKELFNERVVVKLAGNVDLEGNRAQQGVSNFAGDIKIEYKLTEDGRFRLQGFRNNEFDNLQGEIIETGVGIIYVREYNAFRELFRRTREEKEAQNE